MNKKLTRSILAVVLCIVTAFSLTACSVPGLSTSFEKIRNIFSNRQSTTSPIPAASVESGLPAYEHYDPTEFQAACDTFETYLNAGNMEAAAPLYKSLSEELLRIETNASIAYVKTSENVEDTYYSDEYQYTSDTYRDCANRFFSICHNATQGPSADAFYAYLGNDYEWEELVSYKPMDGPLQELFSQEDALINQYRLQADTVMDITCTIDGVTYSFEDVIGENSDQLFAQNYDLALEIYDQCYTAYNQLVGETFLQLLKVRTQIAQAYGYDNYADYADAEIYERDYTSADLENMKEAVRDAGSLLNDYTSLFSNSSDFPSYVTTEQMLQKTTSVLADISPLLQDAVNVFYQDHAYSVGSDDHRRGGAFTIYLSSVRRPFLFASTSQTAADYTSIAHEFGHFTAFYETPNPDPLYRTASLDIEETHSQGLEILFEQAAGKALYGNDAEIIRTSSIADLAYAILFGCIMDDWQRSVYANPDMTLEELNMAYLKTELAYGASMYPGLEYGWCDILHNFESPLYYISYAISAFGALQIWDISRNDFNGAVSAWENLVTQDYYIDSYTTIMHNAGLRTFDEEGVPKKLLTITTDYLQDKTDLLFEYYDIDW